MDYNTIFVGMDVHKEIFSLCCYSIEKDEFSHPHTTAADYKHILAYIASLRGVFGENAFFLCGYEAGCMGFTLYHQLTEQLPDFTEDGVYALELEAVDEAGNTSGLNISTYARMVNQDVLAYITNSSVENKSGLYSFQYENGTPISMRPESFTDLDITVFAKKGSEVDIVLRDTNAEEVYVNARADADNSIYGFTIYNFMVSADFFKDSFSSMKTISGRG